MSKTKAPATAAVDTGSTDKKKKVKSVAPTAMAEGGATPVAAAPQPELEVKPAAGKKTRAPAKSKSVAAASAPTAPENAAINAPVANAPGANDGDTRLVNEQQLLDESLVETFPASDPISPSPAARAEEADPADRIVPPPATDAPFLFPTAENPDPGPQYGTGDGAGSAHTSRDERIRIAAYLRAEARGFEPGYDVEDWLSAEAEHKDS